MARIPESGLVFGEYEEQDLFRIENSLIQRKAGATVKTVEFVLLRKTPTNKTIIFLEAKSSCPNIANIASSEEKRAKYEQFYSDVSAKFTDSVSMLSAALLGRYEKTSEIGENLAEALRTKGYDMRFVLVISSAEESWLQGPKAELDSRLLKIRQIWKCSVAVLNKDLAMKYGLLCTDE